MNELKINPIKPLVQVPDFSLYIFILLVLCILFLITYISYYLYKKIKNKKINMQKVYKRELKKIEIKESKSAAYSITKYALLILKNETQTILAKELIGELNQYKYKKTSKEFNEKTIVLLNKFKDTL